MANKQSKNLQQIFNKAHSDQNALAALLQIGRTEGFQTNINRRLIWPFLLNMHHTVKTTPVFSWKNKKAEKCRDYSIIDIDVQRSLGTWQMYQKASKFVIKKKHEAILQILNIMFNNQNDLFYYQGFHEIACMFTTLFNNDNAYYMTKLFGEIYLYDFLVLDFTETTFVISQIVGELVGQFDRDFNRILNCFDKDVKGKENTTRKIIVFILPWVLSMFARVSTSVMVISRVWDYLLCTGAFGVFYLCAAIIVVWKKELIKKCENLQEQEFIDFFQNYAKKFDYKIEQALQMALKIEQSVQISQLKSYKSLHQKSRYRKQNFTYILSIHKQYHEKRIASVKSSKSLNTVVRVGGGIVLFVAAVMLLNKNKIGKLDL